MSVPSILLIIFNRPGPTRRVIEAIRAVQPSRLYVAADGPRPGRQGEAELCAEARRIAVSVDWPCVVETLFREDNLGCREAVSSAISWFFEHEAEGIILEDDCVPHRSFFFYCAELLERYRDNPRIMCITGNNFQRTMGDYPYSYFYSIYNHIWGWASWRRAWALYDAEMSTFNREFARQRLNELSDVEGFAENWMGRFERVQARDIDTWDYIWTWSCWANGGLTCTPRINLVSNIGFGDDATHTRNEVSDRVNMRTGDLAMPLSSPPRIEPMTYFDDYYSNKEVVRKSFIRRVTKSSRRFLMKALLRFEGREI